MSEESSQNNNREREEDEIGSEMEDGLFDEDLSVLEEIISPNSSTTPKKWKSRKYGELFEQISSKRLKCKLCLDFTVAVNCRRNIRSNRYHYFYFGKFLEHITNCIQAQIRKSLTVNFDVLP